MNTNAIRVAVLACAVAVPGLAAAQSIPTSQPKYLQIVREQVKPGRAAEHARWESGWPAAYEKAKSSYTWLALTSMTGPSEAWYLIPYASNAGFAEMLAAEDKDAGLRAELDRLARGDGDFVSETLSYHTVARPDLSHGAYPDLAMMRFWEISIFRAKPGHNRTFEEAAKAWAASSKRNAPDASWRTYQVIAGAPGGTFIVFSSLASFAEFDRGAEQGEKTWSGLTFEERQALEKWGSEGTFSTITNRFRLDPAQSYVSAEVRQKDPAFWMPKPGPTKVAAKRP